VDAVGDGEDLLVAQAFHVLLAVTLCSLLTALAELERRSERAVMSSWRWSPSTPRASSRTRSIGTPPVPLRPSPS